MAIKVSQATIDKIKEMGMTKALKSAGKASPEMREGLKRMYGARRFNAAVSSTKPYNVQPQRTADSARAAATSKPTYKSADAARSAMPGKGPMAKVSTSAKKSGTTDPFAKFVFGIGNKLNADNRTTAAKVAAINKARAAGKETPDSKSKPKATVESVKAINAKRMGISVAEYNKRLAAAQKAKKSK